MSASTPALETALEEIRNDRSRGASELAQAGLAWLVQNWRATEGEERDRRLAAVREAADRLARTRPAMAAIANWAAAFAVALVERVRAGTEEPECTLRAELTARQAGMLDDLIAAAAREIAGFGSILTISYSSTVAALLSRATARDCLIVVAEARPLMEGRKLCERLEAEGRRVRLITDAQVGLAMRDADAALIGADAVLADLAAVNKTGSLLVALAAREAGKPFHVAADTFKIDCRHTSTDAPVEEMAGAEVWPGHGEICDNIYFEPVPGELIDRYLTEKGPLDGAAMAREVAACRRLRDQAGMAA